MHSLILITGSDIDKQMLHYADYKKVDPFKVYLDDSEIQAIAKHYSVPEDDLKQISELYKDWAEQEADIDTKGIYWMSRDNPNGKFDWYRKGGRFKGYLKLLKLRKPSRIKKLFGASPTNNVNVAIKCEICPSTFTDQKPAGILHQGAWSECPLNAGSLEVKEWEVLFMNIYESLSDDTLITVLDIHG